MADLPESLAPPHLLYGKMKTAGQVAHFEAKRYSDQQELFIFVGLIVPFGAFPSREVAAEYLRDFQAAKGDVSAQRRLLLSLTQRLLESLPPEEG